MANTTQELTFQRGTHTLTVQANGGTVEVQVYHPPGDVWITSDTITADQAGQIRIGHARVRIVPSGGATWAVR